MVDEIKFKTIRGERVVAGTRLAKVLEDPTESLEESLDEYREAHTNLDMSNPYKAYFTCVNWALEYDIRRAIIKERKLLPLEKIQEYDGKFGQINEMGVVA